jgi:hypothetical protein
VLMVSTLSPVGRWQSIASHAESSALHALGRSLCASWLPPRGLATLCHGLR